MPIFNFLVVAAYALITLLFVADAILEPRSAPVIVTSQRLGLPESRRPDPIQTLTARPAPAPDMTSQAVLAAQAKSVSDALAKIESAAHGARAEAAPRREHPQNNLVRQPIHYQQPNTFDRFSIKGY
jgi:hypothetical protein